MGVKVNGFLSAGSGLLGVGSSLFGSSNQLKAVRETNKANKEIAELNNRWNRENMQLQNDWNLQQWQRENEYNSASAQVKRFRDAGLNPYLAITGGADAGSASSITSADVAPASDVGKQMPADYSGYQQTSQLLSQMPVQLAQAENLGASTDQQQAQAEVYRRQAEQLGIQNWYQGAKSQLEIMQSVANLDISGQQKKLLIEDLESKQRENALLGDVEVNNARKQIYVQRARLYANQAATEFFNSEIKKKEDKNWYKQFSAQVNKLVADTAAANASAGLMNQDAKLSFERTFLYAFDGKIRKMIGEQGIKRLADNLVNHDTYSIEKDKVMSENLGDLWMSEMVRNYGAAFGDAVGNFLNAFGGSETTGMNWNGFGNDSNPNPGADKAHRGHVHQKNTSFKKFNFRLPKFGK